MQSQVAPQGGQLNIADYRPLCVGSQWHYQGTHDGQSYDSTDTASEQVVINGKPAIRIDHGQGDADYVWTDRETGLWWFGWDQEGSGSTRIDPPLNLPATVSVGQSFHGTSRMLLNGTDSGEFSWTITFTGIESVSTPAGSFADCVVLVHEFVSPDGTDTGHGWCARGVGEVRHDGSSTGETGESWSEVLVWADVCGQHFGNMPQ